MKIFIVAISACLAFGSLARGEQEPPMKPLLMEVAVVYDFVVSLMELREDTQHKRFDDNELKVIADALSTARFLKKMGHEDIARTPYISRYQFSHGFLGGTPRTGETEFGMLTMDCRTFYWEEGIFELDEANAAKLRRLFPKPKNPLTKSELPAIRAEDKKAEQAGTGQPASRSELKSEGNDKPQPESEGRSR